MGWIRWRLRPSGVVCSLLNSASVRTCDKDVAGLSAGNAGVLQGEGRGFGEAG